jgi:hypothetical protein
MTPVQSAGILFASFVLGGDCLPGAIKSLLSLQRGSLFEDVFSLFMTAIIAKHGQLLGAWIESHWQFMNITHLSVMGAIKSTPTVSDINLLTLLLTVDASDSLSIIRDFVVHLDGSYVYELILSAIDAAPR